MVVGPQAHRAAPGCVAPPPPLVVGIGARDREPAHVETQRTDHGFVTEDEPSDAGDDAVGSDHEVELTIVRRKLIVTAAQASADRAYGRIILMI